MCVCKTLCPHLYAVAIKFQIWKKGKTSHNINPIFSKMYQVIYFSVLIQLPNIKALTQILSEISCTRKTATNGITDVRTYEHLLVTTVLIFRLKIPKKTPKYPTSASNLFGTYFGHLRNKWQVPNIYPKYAICGLEQMDRQTDGRTKAISLNLFKIGDINKWWNYAYNCF